MLKKKFYLRNKRSCASKRSLALLRKLQKPKRRKKRHRPWNLRNYLKMKNRSKRPWRRIKSLSAN